MGLVLKSTIVDLYRGEGCRQYSLSTEVVWLGLRRGAFTCVGLQVTLCNPIWQVTLRSSVMGFQSIKSYTQLYLYLLPTVADSTEQMDC